VTPSSLRALCTSTNSKGAARGREWGYRAGDHRSQVTDPACDFEARGFRGGGAEEWGLPQAYLMVKELSLDKPQDEAGFTSTHVPEEDKLCLLKSCRLHGIV